MTWQMAFNRSPWRISVTTVLGLAGFALLVTVFAGGDLRAIGSLLVLGDERKAAILLLLLVIGIEGALWFIGALLLVLWYSELAASSRVSWCDLVLGCLVPSSLLGLSALGFWMVTKQNGVWPPDEIDGFPINMSLGPLAFVVALCSVAGLFATALRAGAEFGSDASDDSRPIASDLAGCHAAPADDGGDEVGERAEVGPPGTSGAELQQVVPPGDLRESVRIYLCLKRLQDRFLALAGLILGVSIVIGFLLTRAHNISAAGLPYSGPQSFPLGYTYAHAGFFSFGLALAFFIARQPLLRAGHGLLHEYIGDVPSSAHKLETWLKDREHARTLLELKAYSLPAAAELLAILGPLIGALLPALVSGA